MSRWNPRSWFGSAKPTMELTPELTRSGIPPAPDVELLLPRAVLLKRLKWVTYRGKIGIVYELDTSGYAVVHLTDAKGETMEAIRVNATELRIAKLAEIPKPRIVGISPQYAATLGYY